MRMMNYIVIFAAALLIILALSLSSRHSIARSYPGFAAYLAFDGNPLTYDRSFTRGHIGPFNIGSTKEDTIRSLSSLPSSLHFSMDMSDQEWQQYGKTDISVITPEIGRFLLGKDRWRVATELQNSKVVFDLFFEGENLSRVDMLSTVLY